MLSLRTVHIQHYPLCTARFQSASRNTFHRAFIGPWGRLEFGDEEPEVQPKDIRSSGQWRRLRPRLETFQLHGCGAGWHFPQFPADAGLPAPSLRGPAPAQKRAQHIERGTLPARRLTCAMPAPISPPPITVTCLTMIFFADAEAADEEDTERTNCRVTKAMVQGQRRRRRHDPAKLPRRRHPQRADLWGPRA